MKIQIGRLELAFALLLALYLAVSAFAAAGIWPLLLQLAVFTLAIWVAVRISRRVSRQLLWRLRNRLVVTYIFIAVVPVVLITALLGFGGYLLAGQLSIYLVTSELERRLDALRRIVEVTAEQPPDRGPEPRNIQAFLRSRYPDAQMLINQHGTETRLPADLTFNAPKAGWTDTAGLLVKDGLLYSWAHATRRDRTVSVLAPVTREYLGRMVPGIGQVSILDLALGSQRNLMHDSLEAVANRVPPASNAFDIEVRWGTMVPVFLWDRPAATDDKWLTVRTRASALLRTVFSPKIEVTNTMVWAPLLGAAILFLVAEIIAFFIGLSLTRTITGAVHDLYEGTVRIAAGDFSHRIPIQGNDQLAELATSFNGMTANMERLLVVEKEKQRLQAELEIAREVQNQLYPKIIPELPSVSLYASCEPARVVSGDYYDYQQIAPGKLAIAIGDVAGKGISAALLMATVQSSFRTQIKSCMERGAAAGGGSSHSSVQTSVVVSQLNQQLHAFTAPEKFSTFYLGIYDEQSATLTYTNAGHLPPVMIKGGEATRLEVNGLVVGAFPSAKYTESFVTFDQGDLLVFFTDGITEPENEYGEMFGEDRLIEIATKNSHLSNTELAGMIMKAVHQWTGSDELQDDMTLLLVRRR
jgi:sigma-B regulation protein RsbU (phosphoserine phosphatase)